MILTKHIRNALRNSLMTKCLRHSARLKKIATSLTDQPPLVNRLSWGKTITPSHIFISSDAAISFSRITTAMTPTATQSWMMQEKRQIGKTNKRNLKRRRRRKKRSKKGSKKEVSQSPLLKSQKKKRLLAKMVRKSKEQRTSTLSRDDISSTKTLPPIEPTTPESTGSSSFARCYFSGSLELKHWRIRIWSLVLHSPPIHRESSLPGSCVQWSSTSPSQTRSSRASAAWSTLSATTTSSEIGLRLIGLDWLRRWWWSLWRWLTSPC